MRSPVIFLLRRLDPEHKQSALGLLGQNRLALPNLVVKPRYARYADLSGEGELDQDLVFLEAGRQMMPAAQNWSM